MVGVRVGVEAPTDLVVAAAALSVFAGDGGGGLVRLEGRAHERQVAGWRCRLPVLLIVLLLLCCILSETRRGRLLFLAEHRLGIGLRHGRLGLLFLRRRL